jgi:hypothetical protein
MALLLLGLGGVAIAVGWLFLCLTSPFVHCRCDGRRRCRACKGSGYRLRTGAQTINQFIDGLRRSL